MSVTRIVCFALVGLFAMFGAYQVFQALGTTASSANETQDPLDAFKDTQSEAAFESAAENWAHCETEDSASIALCSDWTEEGIDFALLAVRGSDGVQVPVVESASSENPTAAQPIIHLTGGPGGSPYATYPDLRTKALSFFHDRGHKIASVAYWGTSFRTNLLRGEIVHAARDFEIVYAHYARECECDPLILGESLGAAIIFHSLSESEAPIKNVLTVAPVMGGIPKAIEYFRSTQSDSELAFSTKLTRIYDFEDGKSGGFKSKRLIETFVHLVSFSQGYDTRPGSYFIDSECPTFIIGRDDPLNQSFSDWDLPSVRVIDDAPHDVVADHTSELRIVFEEFLECQERNT